MRMSHKRLLQRLLRMGWSVVAYAYDSTIVRAPDGREGAIPFAGKAKTARLWTPWRWNKVYKALNLTRKERHG